ncbi:MAG: class I tRNA ligase family protein, partial [Candidatus Aminicenantia bacterium]
QTALFYILKNTLLLMAPILPFTAEEAWENIPNFDDKEESIHLCLFPKFEDKWLSREERNNWEKLLSVREKVLKELEGARGSGLIGNSLEAKVNLKIPASEISFYQRYKEEFPFLFVVSQVDLTSREGGEIEVEVTRAEGEKCERCWNYSSRVGEDTQFPSLCPRCVTVVKELKSKER